METINQALTMLKTGILSLLFAGFLNSCGMIYHTVSSETTCNNSIITQKKTKIKTSLMGCHSKEITTQLARSDLRVIRKEIIIYDCSGSWSYEVKRVVIH
jgi:hypothetical protein